MPDPKPRDFFMWGYMNYILYREKKIIHLLQERIFAAVMTIVPDMLHTWDTTEYHMDL
jgi:hypothetical protein